MLGEITPLAPNCSTAANHHELYELAAAGAEDAGEIHEGRRASAAPRRRRRRRPARSLRERRADRPLAAL
jgi:hypothetical protein